MDRRKDKDYADGLEEPLPTVRVRTTVFGGPLQLANGRVESQEKGGPRGEIQYVTYVHSRTIHRPLLAYSVHTRFKTTLQG